MQGLAQLRNVNEVPVRHHPGVFDAVLQFPHVARPVVLQQQPERPPCHPSNLFVTLLIEVVHEVIHQ